MEKAEDESEKAELKQELSALESKLKKIDIFKEQGKSLNVFIFPMVNLL